MVYAIEIDSRLLTSRMGSEIRAKHPYYPYNGNRRNYPVCRVKYEFQKY